MKPSMSSVKVDIEKFGSNDFGIWQLKMCALNKERSKLGKNTCSYCYKEGHWKVDCPKLKGKKKPFDKSFASVDANIAKDRCSELL
ncbi:phosphatidylinositol 4-kinase alpha 1-like [Pyrus ussuriensis x Pyrus communis]|uniref:Phosphatidylinositol 4-kinase alpha 1-like n=1 Tax=Pyrus ussuriensis x Pyrus communis TaxID=2448454 RepID=A0A5N5FHB8_9ROSA|nr:phosphatidylinositol 4-kinase alpha 1-like [Pyrus ussuriensis x Pyrus communis]